MVVDHMILRSAPIFAEIPIGGDQPPEANYMRTFGGNILGGYETLLPRHDGFILLFQILPFAFLMKNCGDSRSKGKYDPGLLYLS